MNVEEKDKPISNHEEFIGKIIDYQFLVKPKQEPIDDIKPNVDFQLVGEILTDVKVEETNEKNGYEDNKPLINREWFKYQCDQDTSVFRNEWALKSHMIASHNKIIYSCDKCGFQTFNKGYLNRHIKIVHETKSSLKTRARIYNCFQCDFNTPNRCFLIEHETLIHGNNHLTYVCNKCGYQTNTRKKLGNHLSVHHNLMYSCDLCPFKALSPRNITIHKKRFHLKINSKKQKQKRILCDLCGKTFHKDSIKPHLVRAHKKKIELKTYICYTCGFKNHNKPSFIAHVQRHSKSSKMFCANCDYSTHNKSNLIQHMVKHTENVKMHKCHVCKFETKRPHTLRHHIKTHS